MSSSGRRPIGDRPPASTRAIAVPAVGSRQFQLPSISFERIENSNGTQVASNGPAGCTTAGIAHLDVRVPRDVFHERASAVASRNPGSYFIRRKRLPITSTSGRRVRRRGVRGRSQRPINGQEIQLRLRNLDERPGLFLRSGETIRRSPLSHVRACAHFGSVWARLVLLRNHDRWHALASSCGGGSLFSTDPQELIAPLGPRRLARMDGDRSKGSDQSPANFRMSASCFASSAWSAVAAVFTSAGLPDPSAFLKASCFAAIPLSPFVPSIMYATTTPASS